MAANGNEGGDDTPGAMLDSFRDHPEWSDRERDFHLGRLVGRFPADVVAAAVRDRLGDLSRPESEVLLRLVEADASPALGRSLGEALNGQADLPADRAWDALAVLDGLGMLDEFPELLERWDELNETLDDEGSVAQLVEQLDGDPEGVWLALQGIGVVEPPVRGDILRGLSGQKAGPGVVEFLRLLSYAHDPDTRAAASEALLEPSHTGLPARAAWRDLAEHHPDPKVAASARRLMAAESGRDSTVWEVALPTPRLVRSLVSTVDGRGRGTVILSAERGRERVTAAFLCSVEDGIVEVIGDQVPARDVSSAEAAFAEYAGRVEGDVLQDAHALASSVLAGGLLLCRSGTPPVLRYWLEATLGPGVQPRPFRAAIPGFDPASLPFDEMPGRTTALLDACPDWIDASALTYELAEEILLRERGTTADPKRDAGVYRLFFSRRLQGQLEGYRRMLLWMCGFWEAAGPEAVELARSALGIAWQLSDAQHVVPGHPFAVALTTRSLNSALDHLAARQAPRL